MGKINWLKKFFRNLIGNIVSQIIIYSLITLGAIVYFKDILLDFFNFSVKIWQVSILLSIILFLIFIYNFYKSKSIHKFLKYGMEWHVNIKKDSVSSIKGPFCPHCLLEMTESKPFQCLICNTKYTALNSTNIEEAQQIVKKIIEAELRGGKTLILDWSTSTFSYPYSSFSLKNNGASSAKDISIQIKLQIDKEIRDIGTYKFEKVEPDKEIKIEKSNPMINVHNTLKEFGLVDINSIELSHEEEDEYGNIRLIPFDLEWKTIRKEFSCNLEVNMKYSFKDKIKNQQNSYLMEFKFVKPDNPLGYDKDEDNCKIVMHQIE